jgi:thiamine biosynthesis lipoprotein
MKSVSNRLARCRPLLGTFVEITAAGQDADAVEKGIEAAFEAVGRVHHLMSFHDADSDVSRLNRARPGEPIVVDAWTRDVLEISLELERKSNGSFNIGVAPALQRLGLLPCSLQPPQAPTAPAAMEAIELLPDKRVCKREPESKVDLGGIAKGYAVDRAVEALRGYGIQGGLVNAGGDLAAFGDEDWVVAIRDPHEPARSLCCVAIRDAALASSGPIFDPLQSSAPRGCAILHPQIGAPVRAICGASVQAASCLIADALTKVVMIQGAAASAVLEHFEASALFVMAGGEVAVTSDWQGACSSAT